VQGWEPARQFSSRVSRGDWEEEQEEEVVVEEVVVEEEEGKEEAR